jgi:hypothetical protein
MQRGFLPRELWSSWISFSITGSAKPIVFPDPVLDLTTISLPAMSAANDLAWTGNRTAIPMSFKRSFVAFEI